MDVVKYEMLLPKDGKEIVDLIDAILEKILKKEPFGSYTDLIDEFMVAVEGVQNVPTEVKSELRDELSGYLVHKLMGRLWAGVPVNE